MPRYALTMNGVTVERTAVFKETPGSLEGHPTKSRFKWLEVVDAQPEEGKEGWEIDLESGTATLWPKYRPPVPRKVGTFRELMGLLTDTEKAAILTRAKTDMKVEIWLLEAQGGPEFSLEHSSVLAGFEYLEEKGDLAPGRAAEIVGSDFDAQSE